jgi:hypothetical protein
MIVKMWTETIPNASDGAAWVGTSGDLVRVSWER